MNRHPALDAEITEDSNASGLTAVLLAHAGEHLHQEQVRIFLTVMRDNTKKLLYIINIFLRTEVDECDGESGRLEYLMATLPRASHVLKPQQALAFTGNTENPVPLTTNQLLAVGNGMRKIFDFSHDS